MLSGGGALCVVNVLLGELGAVKPVAPAQVLADQGDGHGCLVWVQLRHVQVVNKVDQLFVAWWPIVDTGLQATMQSIH